MTAVVDVQEGRLPDTYAVFAPVFERLSEPLAHALGGLLEQLEPFAPAFDLPRMAPRGEFEGLGGLTLRGDIDHIVQSELLLRTEAPMEFLRRLAESETLYHEKVYADPGRRPIYRLMVSVGSGAMGHGRIVALAAVFFMARVALARNADFHWCFLPRTDGAVWFDDISVNNIKRLLRSASYREASADDVADAWSLWTRLWPEVAADRAAERIDWLVIADGFVGSLGVADAPSNSFSYALQPPQRSQPRLAEIRLRHLGRERRRAFIAFPPDAACLGALKTPFRPPPARVAALPQGGVSRRSQGGWAPQYLVNAAADMKLVRMSDGLLLLWVDADLEVARSLFIPVAEDVRLAGLRVYREGITLIIHAERGGSEMLALGTYLLPASGGSRLTFRRQVRSPTAQLFRQQPAFALPTFTQIGGARFHSTSGQPFQIAFDQQGEQASFQPLYKGPRMIGSNGVHDVVRIEGTPRSRIDVLRPSGYETTSFAEGDVALLPPRLLGLRYTHSSASLAYSLSPNCWQFARPWAVGDGYQVDDTPVILKPWETLLAGTARPRDVAVRVWSDARYGGEGEIRNVRFSEGEATVRQPILRLGDNAAAIVALDIGDDGVIWGVSADSAGEPEGLLSYRKARRSSGTFKCVSISLEEHRAKAAVLKLEALLG